MIKLSAAGILPIISKRYVNERNTLIMNSKGFHLQRKEIIESLVKFFSQFRFWKFTASLLVSDSAAAENFKFLDSFSGTDQKISIGRSTRATIKLDDEKVSAMHAELEITSEGVFIRDLNSKNSTLVNGMHVKGSQGRRLFRDDIVKIGSRYLKFVIDFDVVNDRQVDLQILKIFGDKAFPQENRSSSVLVEFACDAYSAAIFMNLEIKILISIINSLFALNLVTMTCQFQLSRIEKKLITYLIEKLIDQVNCDFPELGVVALKAIYFDDSVYSLKTLDFCYVWVDYLVSLNNTSAFGYIGYPETSQRKYPEHPENENLREINCFIQRLSGYKIPVRISLAALRFQLDEMRKPRVGDILISTKRTTGVLHHSPVRIGEVVMRSELCQGNFLIGGSLVIKDGMCVFLFENASESSNDERIENMEKADVHIDSSEGVSGEQINTMLTSKIIVPITVELNPTFITVKKLSELKIGSILEMNHKPDEAVLLRCDRSIMGKGRLVIVEDSLGVEVIEWLLENPSDQ